MQRNVPRPWLALAAALAVGLAAPADAPAGGKKANDDSDAFFKAGKVVELVIELAPKELESLRREPRKYAKATVKVDGKVYKDVGLKVKGAAGSFRGIDDKPGLTLNMDKFSAGQLFHGLDKFHLANSVQDPSYLSELVCGELFRAAGVPAARVSHAVVTINGRRRGLYYLKEGYDTSFLKRHFGDGTGNFYDGGFLRDLDQPLQLLSGKTGKTDHAELKALMAAAREGNPKERFRKLEKLLDLDRFLSYVALQVIAWDWDGYPMNRNNYRVYHDPTSKKIVFLPSGMDQMFSDPNGTLFPNFQGAVARALVTTPEGKERYLARVAEIMRKVYRADALDRRLEELQGRVQPALASVDAGAGRDYPNHVRRLRDAVKHRQKNVEEQLKALRK
jgi:spore coat protein H